jgi:hypothetical protein
VRANFLEIKEAKYSNHFPIYTGGSKRNEKTGCVVVKHNNIQKLRLMDDSSLFTAKLLGILKALKSEEIVPNASIIIFTDSLSSIQSIEDIYSHGSSQGD